MPHMLSLAVNNSYSQPDSGNLTHLWFGHTMKSVAGGPAQIEAAKQYRSMLSDLLDFRIAQLPLDPRKVQQRVQQAQALAEIAKYGAA